MSENRPPRGERETQTNGSHRGGDPRGVSGNVRVSGKIEANLPPDFVEKYHSSNKESDLREKKRFIVECITLVFVAIVAVFGLVQTNQSIKSADAAKQSADVVSKALDLTRAQILPAIVVERMDIRQPLIPDQVTPVSHIFKNTGGSVAVDAESFSTTYSSIDGKGPLWEFHDFSGSKASVGAGELFDSPVVLPPQTATQIDQFHSGTRKFYATGLITYKDVTGTMHHFYYCFDFDPKTGNGNGCRETKQSD